MPTLIALMILGVIQGVLIGTVINHRHRSNEESKRLAILVERFVSMHEHSVSVIVAQQTVIASLSGSLRKLDQRISLVEEYGSPVTALRRN